MKAGFFLGNRKIEIRQTAQPAAGPGEVLLKVVACGVCGTDNHIFEGELTDGVFPPVVLGHEIAARIEALGPGVEGFDKGQFCAVDPLIGCGRCPACRQGQPNLCDTPTIIGYKLNGGFEQYLTAPASKIVPMDESSGPAGGVLCETLACVVNGYDRLGFVAGCNAMILGAGTVGLLWTGMFRNSSCEKLLQSELVEFRRNKAARLGADVVLDPSQEGFVQSVRQEYPNGLDFIVDATGSPAAIEQAIGLLAKGGTFMIFGVCPAGSSIRVDPFDLYNKQARVIASKMPPGTLDRAARLINSGKVACDEIVTHTLPMDHLAQAVEGFNADRHKQVKVAIAPWA